MYEDFYQNAIKETIILSNLSNLSNLNVFRSSHYSRKMRYKKQPKKLEEEIEEEIKKEIKKKKN